ncbi:MULTISPECIES: hypothetical protein [unclassified Streptomyces]|uniref:hypothetical protein n=1 Tax=unclassified Streptomyces TaxID=2593676 RepID=UPI0035DDFD6F
MRKFLAALAAPALVLAAAASSSAAVADTASWNAFPGTDSRWHCGPTVTIRSGFQAQSCIVKATDAISYQGATIINLAAPTRVYGVTETYEAGTFTGLRNCSTSLNPELRPAGRSVCFSKTVTGSRGNAVQTRSLVEAGASEKLWTSPTIVLG